MRSISPPTTASTSSSTDSVNGRSIPGSCRSFTSSMPKAAAWWRSVGVVTRLIGDTSGVSITSLPLAHSPVLALSTRPATAPSSQPAAPEEGRLVAGPAHRGILKDVLQPGIYYLNPRMLKVTIVPVGFDQITLQEATNNAIQFTSTDAYQVECELTVVWGRSPDDAPSIVA